MGDAVVDRSMVRLPVVIGSNHEHVVAKAEIFRNPNAVMIQITSEGAEGQLLAEFLEQMEPVVLKFDVIPVQNIREKRENI